MEDFGNTFLYFALVVSAYTFVTSLVGGLTNQPALVRTSRYGIWVMSGLVTGSSLLLLGCLLTGRFHVQYVYQYTNSTMPFFYKAAALWGGQNGSLLFWLLILCLFSSVVVWRHFRQNQELIPYVITTLSAISSFFLILLIFSANPFDTLPFAVRDGQGLNPLLQNYYMVIHPPSLYFGYVGMSVPFAFAMAALISGRLDNQWILQIRKWTLTAWLFLSLGNLLGALWAYEVLGWGGYWGWDPVENAALIPWLTATAFLHSVIIQEKRGMLRIWNMVLVILSFLLTITGTFLTRSGIVSSVHSFARSGIGYYFFWFLVISTLVPVFLLWHRRNELKSRHTLESLVSRESAFLFNNLILVGAALAILWGTIFPVLTEWVQQQKISVGPPYFNRVMVPIGLLLLLLTGVGPIVAWRKTSLAHLKKNFIWPTGSAIATSLAVSLWITTSLPAVFSLSICAFVLVTILAEYRRGVLARKRTLKEGWLVAFLRLIRSNVRRYGGYIVHIGIVLMFVGFTGEAFKQEKELTLRPEQVESLGSYKFRFNSMEPTRNRHKETLTAHISVWKGDHYKGIVHPARIFYANQIPGGEAQTGTEIAIQRSLAEDFYVALLSFDFNRGEITVKVVINPLVQFIWIGGLFLILGTGVVMWPTSGAVGKTRQIGKSYGQKRWRQLEEERITSLAALRELDFDFEMGKLSAEDYRELRDQYQAKAASVLKELDGKDGAWKEFVGKLNAKLEDKLGFPPAPEDESKKEMVS